MRKLKLVMVGNGMAGVVGIQTKRYFYPPLHAQALFQRFPRRVSSRLGHTNKISREALALPLYSHTTLEEIDHVCVQVERLLS